jgi:hypothetical protein
MLLIRNGAAAGSAALVLDRHRRERRREPPSCHIGAATAPRVSARTPTRPSRWSVRPPPPARHRRTSRASNKTRHCAERWDSYVFSVAEARVLYMSRSRSLPLRLSCHATRRSITPAAIGSRLRARRSNNGAGDGVPFPQTDVRRTCCRPACVYASRQLLR